MFILINLGSYINTIPRWTIETNLDEKHSEKKSISLKQLIGSGLSVEENEFVNPSSNEELWWPSDIDTIQVRPTLDIFMKSASPAYLLAGVEVRVPPSASKDGREWKNFGMNSQPLATQWTAFNIAVENGFRVETFVGKGKKVEDNGEEEKKEDKNEIKWEPLYSIGNEVRTSDDQKDHSTKETLNAIKLLGNFLAEWDENSPLEQGMHIVSIPISSEWRDMPSPNIEKDEKITLVSVGTVEPDAMGLLSMDDDLVALSATSVLKVDVEIVAPGSKSQYIPVSSMTFVGYIFHHSLNHLTPNLVSVSDRMRTNLYIWNYKLFFKLTAVYRYKYTYFVIISNYLHV